MLKPKIVRYGNKGLLLNWPLLIDAVIHQTILNYQIWIEKELKNSIQETNIGYQSLLILVKTETDIPPIISALTRVNAKDLKESKRLKQIYTIPVCYDESLGLDIKSLSKEKALNIDQIIELHTEPTYKVHFIGFLPGFLYLSGLNPILHTPRLAEPRLEIPKGSVAIGGEQTGIYPQNSPGGWQIIGKTPLHLFDAKKDIPSICEPGDFIKFKSISLNTFKTTKKEVELGNYKLRKEAMND